MVVVVMIPAIVVIVIAVRGVMMMRTLCRIASHVGNGSKNEPAHAGARCARRPELAAAGTR